MVESTNEKDFPRSVERGAARKSMDSLCSEPCPPLDRGDRGSRGPFIRRREMKREGETGRPCAHSLCPGRSRRIKSYLNWQEKKERAEEAGRVKVTSVLEQRTTLCFLSSFLGKVLLLLTTDNSSVARKGTAVKVDLMWVLCHRKQDYLGK